MTAFRALIIASFGLLAACSENGDCALMAACSSGNNGFEHEVQRPGQASASGLQVPPDMWARPATQTASLPSR